MQQEKTQIKARVNREIYVGDGGFSIVLIQPEDTFEPISAKGIMHVEVGEEYIFSGEVKEDDRFGDYLHVYSYEKPKINSGEDIIKYLSSSKFEGVGKRSAQKIVTALGTDALDQIKNNPACLDNVNITETVKQEIITKHGKDEVLSDLYAVLVPFNLSEFIISNLYQYILQKKIANPISQIKNNPYSFIKDVYGFTYEKADEIYLALGGSYEDELRIYAYIKYIIQQNCYKSGDTLISLNELILIINAKFNLNQEQTNDYLNVLINERELYAVDDFIALKQFYECEQAIASNIKLRLQDLIYTLNQDAIVSEITNLEAKFNINYSEVQKDAIINALTNNFSIITGGPGTGKTTIVKAIVNIFENLRYEKYSVSDITQKIMLCAPTGRAAQRMKEATGYPAKTIHSLLGWDPHKNKFVRGIDEPLNQELIIIDEFSMVDIFLCEALFKAIRPGTMVIIVGDQAQLESVNPGNVLADLLESDVVSQIKLDIIFRQGEGSSIAKLAKSINTNQKIEFVKTADMGFLNRDGNLIETVYQIQKRSYDVGYDQLNVQVLYPKYKGRNGIDKLNERLKPEIIDEDKVLEYAERKYQVGDKVMQLKNNYEKEIYNGDIGFITKIYRKYPKKKELAMQVAFREEKIDLTREDLEEITHAYAISIHKSQGSEFGVVILPVSSESKNMLTKKLLYTAVTRTKDKLIVIGELNQFDYGIKEQDYRRKTALAKLCLAISVEKSPLDFL